MAKVEHMLHKMMRRFDASDEHIKELRYNLAIIGQKVDTHANGPIICDSKHTTTGHSS